MRKFWRGGGEGADDFPVEKKLTCSYAFASADSANSSTCSIYIDDKKHEQKKHNIKGDPFEWQTHFYRQRIEFCVFYKKLIKSFINI